jgi:ABC-type lipoprotein export system ATPase subunit
VQRDLRRRPKAIARAIEKMPAPEGVVLAINGPWGSGKSSAINLIRHHLAPAIDNERVTFRYRSSRLQSRSAPFLGDQRRADC